MAVLGIEPTNDVSGQHFGGAGEKLTIETGLRENSIEEIPQRHVLPLHHTTFSRLKRKAVFVQVLLI